VVFLLMRRPLLDCKSWLIRQKIPMEPAGAVPVDDAMPPPQTGKEEDSSGLPVVSPETVVLSPVEEPAAPASWVKALVIQTKITLQAIKRGIIVRFLSSPPDEADRTRIASIPGWDLFDLSAGEYITEVRYGQDKHVLLAVQFVTSAGRETPVYRAVDYPAASLSHRYVAPPERGEIMGLVRAKSAAFRGTIIQGITHALPLGDNIFRRSVLLLGIADADKRSCLARTCFYLNVLCCAQTCAGKRVSDFSCDSACAVLACLTCLPRLLVSLPLG